MEESLGKAGLEKGKKIIKYLNIY